MEKNKRPLAHYINGCEIANRNYTRQPTPTEI